ncbi:MAG: glycosyltransferase family 39 protein [Deltaproteobacteria bacterium]|nr:glycosyltransferase family 39 protein [Deltaproteobacteria bacterium]
MDEFTDTQLACQLAKGAELYYDGSFFFRMPFLEHFLSWFCNGAQDSFATLVVARQVMLSGSMVIMFFTYLTARRVFGSVVGLLALFMLCTYTTFLDRSFHVRADLLSTVFASGALFFATLSRRFATILTGVLLGFAIITTQKAIYFVLAFAVALIFCSLTCERNFKTAFRVIVKKTFLSIVGFLVCTGLYFSFIYFNWDYDIFFSKVFVDAFEAGITSHVYTGTWAYLKLTIQRNPVIWFLGVYSIAIAILIPLVAKLRFCENRKQYKLLAFIGAWGSVQLFFTAYHTVKFPYFFLNVAPILAITSSLALVQLFTFSVFVRSWQKTIIVIGLVVVISYFPIKRHLFHLENREKTAIQKVVISRVESLTTVDDAVLDGVGMVVSRKKATPYSMTSRWHARRQTGQYEDVLRWIERTEPKIFIHNYRYDKFSVDEREYISENFIHDWANIWVVGKQITFSRKVTKKSINLLTNTQYAVLCGDISKVFIDGSSAKKIMKLQSGYHLIQVEYPVNKVTIILASAYTQKKPDFPDRHYKLFPSYYE